MQSVMKELYESIEHTIDDLTVAFEAQQSGTVLAPDLLAQTTNYHGFSVDLLETDFRSYKRRWFVLFLHALFKFSSFWMSASYGAIANYVDEFYCTHPGCHATNWIMLSYSFANIPVGFLTLYLGDVLGYRAGMLVGMALNLCGALLRVLSSLPFIDQHFRFPIVLAGEIMAGAAMPFGVGLTGKLAGLWFNAKQRPIAAALVVNAAMMGLACAVFLAPIIVREIQHVAIFNMVSAVLPAVVLILALVGLRSSVPPTPPTASAAQRDMPFWQGLKSAATNKDYLMQVVIMGGSAGLTGAILGLSQQILCSNGYTNVFVGVSILSFNMSALLFTPILGIIVSKTGKLVEMVKFCHAVLLVDIIALCFFARSERMHVWLVISYVGLVAINCAVPLHIEIAAEITYPVAQGTSVTLLIIAIQAIQSIAFIVLPRTAALSSPDNFPAQTCTLVSVNATDTTSVGAVLVYDWTWPLVGVAICVGALSALCLFAFRPKLRRLANEKRVHKASIALSNARSGAVAAFGTTEATTTTTAE